MRCPQRMSHEADNPVCPEDSQARLPASRPFSLKTSAFAKAPADKSDTTALFLLTDKIRVYSPAAPKPWRRRVSTSHAVAIVRRRIRG